MNDRLESSEDRREPIGNRPVDQPIAETRGIKRPLVQWGSQDDWDPQSDDLLKKLQEVKKLKGRDAEHMRPPRRYHSEDQRRLETISECAELFGNMHYHDSSLKAQIVKCKIPVNVATASPTTARVIQQSSKTHMYRRLQSEHLQLQKSFALLRQLVAESFTGTYEQNDKPTWEEERKDLLRTTHHLKTKVGKLQEKVNEYQEQNELLEFRILELDTIQPKETKAVRERACNTDYCSTFDDCYSCLESFRVQVDHCRDLAYKVEVLQSELETIYSLPGLSCSQRRAIAQSAICVSNCAEKLSSLRGGISSLGGCPTPSPAALEIREHWPDLLEKAECQNVNSNEDNSQILPNLCEDQKIAGRMMSGSLVVSEDEGLGEEGARPSTGPSSLLEDSESERMNSSSDFADCELDSRLSESFDFSARLELQNELFRVTQSLRSAESVIEELRSVIRDKDQYKLGCPNQASRTILELEERLGQSETHREELQEQVLELEEAENDARLESQTLQTMVDNLKYREMDLENELNDVRFKLEDYEKQLLDTTVQNEEFRTQMGYLQVLVEKYEEHIENLDKSHPRTSTGVQTECLSMEQETQTEQALPDEPPKELTPDSSLRERLKVLEAKDGQLREELHKIDGDNLKLWGKLHAVDVEIDECRRIEQDDEQMHVEASARLDDLLTTRSLDMESNKSGGEQPQLGNRLVELENINREFEKELGVREKLCRQKETECRDWVDRETRMSDVIKGLRLEKEEAVAQLNDLVVEQSRLTRSLGEAREEADRVAARHSAEVEELEAGHRELVGRLELRIESLKEREAETADRIADLETEKKTLLALLANGKEAQRLPEVRDQLSQIRNEQKLVQSEMSEATAELRLMNEALSVALALLIEKHRCVESEHLQEIHSLKTKEEMYRSEASHVEERASQIEMALREKEEELQVVERNFKKKLSLIEEEHHLVENELQWKLREMESGTSVAVKALEEKRKQLEQNLQDDLMDLRKKEDSYKGRIQALERHVDCLRQEVNNFSSSSGILGNESAVSGTHLEEDTFECLSMEERLVELEKKEAAYMETLESADKIVHQMEVNYRQKIGDLESSERNLQQRVQQLEENEEQLKAEIHQSGGWRVADLVKELTEAESRENMLREKLEEMENMHKSQLQRSTEMEKQNSQLREELKDNEELGSSLEMSKKRLESLDEEMSKLRLSESALKETLRQADDILVQREIQLLRQVDELEREKRQTEEVVEQLREQVRLLKDNLDSVKDEDVIVRTGKENDQAQEIIRLRTSESHLEQEVARLQERLSTSVVHLDESERVRLDQGSLIMQLEADRARTVTEDGQQTAQAYLLQRVAQLENAVRYHESRLKSDTDSTEPQETPTDCQEPEIVSMDVVGGKEEEDLGMVERLKLEECVSRAMEAMERDLKEQTRLRPALSPSTSGCESDAGSEWSGRQHTLSASEEEEEDWDSDAGPRSYVVKSKDLPQPVIARVIYPTFTKTTVKEQPILLTRHSQNQSDVNSTLQSPEPDAPSNLKVLRQVGKDSLLIGWSPPQDSSRVHCYQIFVEGKLHQQARSPDRTKALLHKLDLSSEPFCISIRSLCAGGSLSQPAEVIFDPASPPAPPALTRLEAASLTEHRV